MKKQNGFALGYLVLLILIAIVAAVAVIVAHHKRSTPATAYDQSSQTASNQTKTTQKYLVVKEWGIKLPLSNNISDAYYVVSTSSKDSSGSPNTMWLGLKSLDSSGCAAAGANTGRQYPLGSLLRVTPDEKDPVSGTLYKQLDPDGTTIGGYYYAYHSGVNGKACAPQAKLKQVDSSFKTAADSIVKQ